ncbi:MAG TPA: hypothetical protein VEJ63_16740 [Planctomycetota bacterium]|nr:hypothetical protein [Planctomycetota bacterium]
MRRMDLAGFNKEKLIFIVTAVIFSVSLYLFLATGPVHLEGQPPIGVQPSPPPLVAHDMTQQRDENYYVVRANLTRRTPFAPHSDIPAAQPKVVQAPTGPVAPPPPAPPPQEKKEEITKKVWDAKDLDVQVEYMGVMSLNGVAYALVKPKDGGQPLRVKAGDKIDEFGYEVTDINKQEILMKDSENRPFILKDTRFSEEDADAADDDGEKPEKKEVKKAETKKPEPKKPEAKPAPAPAPQAQPAQPAGAQNNPPRGSHERRPRPGAENRPKKKGGN